MDVRKKQKMRKLLRSRSGVTLVELVIVFALIGMFVVLSTQVISSAMGMYNRLKGVQLGQEIADTLMNKIVGEVSDARVTSATIAADGSVDPTPVKISADGKELELINSSGSRLRITSGIPKLYTYNEAGNAEVPADYPAGSPVRWGDQLIIHYYVAKSQTGAQTVYQPVDWTFDAGLYQGYKIKTLLFSRPDTSYPGHLIRVELVLEHVRYGEYKAVRYIDLHNFVGYEDKISPEQSPP